MVTVRTSETLVSYHNNTRYQSSEELDLFRKLLVRKVANIYTHTHTHTHTYMNLSLYYGITKITQSYGGLKCRLSGNTDIYLMYFLHIIFICFCCIGFTYNTIIHRKKKTRPRKSSQKKWANKGKMKFWVKSYIQLHCRPAEKLAWSRQRLNL